MKKEDAGIYHVEDQCWIIASTMVEALQVATKEVDYLEDNDTITIDKMTEHQIDTLKQYDCEIDDIKDNSPFKTFRQVLNECPESFEPKILCYDISNY